VALRAALALPSGMAGPRERLPLEREAAVWAGVGASGMAGLAGMLI
jgi:hypothetical protein